MSPFSYDVIVIGGGPAGASCAFELNRHGMRTLILDKQSFPRPKLCAGWLPPDVFNILRLTPNDYPHGLTVFKRLMIHFKGVSFPLYHRQYAIRRIEFDDWLLKRSGVPVIRHKVQHIIHTDDRFIIDGQYTCRYLIGAGGTHCPVYKTFFRSLHPRSKDTLITTIEEEFPYDVHHHEGHLWFFENNLPGYAWYVPKKGGYVNVGIGGALQPLKQEHATIRMHWNHLVEKLQQDHFVTRHAWHPRGYQYYLRQPLDTGQSGNAFVIGDAAGMATLDMGEGIGPAIKSGQMVAQSIVHSRPYSPADIRQFSGPAWLSRRLLKISAGIISRS